jgi:alpha-galactosidase
MIIGNQWIERRFLVDEQGVFRTTGLYASDGTALALESPDEFRFYAYAGRSGLVMTANTFAYMNHEYRTEADGERLLVRLVFKGDMRRVSNPFALLEDSVPVGTIEVELDYFAFRDHPVIRKRLKVSSGYEEPIRLWHFAWEDLKLPGGERLVRHNFFTESSPQAINNMDECVMAVHWPERQEGLFLATEAPGSMKRMELFKEPDLVQLMYNNNEETIFEWELSQGESFQSDYGFVLPYRNMEVDDAVDGPLRSFVREKLAVCKSSQVPSFTINTWEPYHNDIDEQLIVDNIAIAGDIGIDAFQLDCGWYKNHGHYEPHPEKFPHGLDAVKKACRDNGIDLGLWMSVPSVHKDAPIYREHPEWLLRDDNGEPIFMFGWPDTHLMCLESDYRHWILDEMDRVAKQHEVKLLKLDLVAVRDPYQPNKWSGCHHKGHWHRTHKASHLGIYRNMLGLMDEMRDRNPGTLLDLTFELYGVAHGMDIKLVQHAHQNWFTNQDTDWLDAFRRLVHTRSRVVPSYTLNFGACHLDDPVSSEYGFWSALLSHGLYYGDLRKLTEKQRNHYRKWIKWVKDYRTRNDFYEYHSVSNVLSMPDAPNHRDRRLYPHDESLGRVKAQGRAWDGAAKLNDQGEGLILLFRPANAPLEYILQMPWMLSDRLYEVNDVLAETLMGAYEGKQLNNGLKTRIREAPGVLVLDVRITG